MKSSVFFFILCLRNSFIWYFYAILRRESEQKNCSDFHFRFGFQLNVICRSQLQQFVLWVNNLQSGWMAWDSKVHCVIYSRFGFHFFLPFPLSLLFYSSSLFLSFSLTLICDKYLLTISRIKFSSGLRNLIFNLSIVDAIYGQFLITLLTFLKELMYWHRWHIPLSLVNKFKKNHCSTLDPSACTIEIILPTWLLSTLNPNDFQKRFTSNTRSQYTFRRLKCINRIWSNFMHSTPRMQSLHFSSIWKRQPLNIECHSLEEVIDREAKRKNWTFW